MFQKHSDSVAYVSSSVSSSDTFSSFTFQGYIIWGHTRDPVHGAAQGLPICTEEIFTHEEAELGDENKPSDGDVCDKLLRELKPVKAFHLL